MFHLQHRDDDLIFHDPLSMVAGKELSVDHAFLESPKLATKISKKRKRESKLGQEENKFDGEKKKGEHKKMMHRDIERQRRQEMASLYASLRELLPLEYIKGRRSISDHMHEAANYIKHMEKNIKDLTLKRDKLKNVWNSPGSENGSSNGVNLPNFVTMNYGYDGVEILINCGHGFALSRILVELIQTGLDVVSCISNKVNGRFLYKIQTEMITLAYINLPQLHQRLDNVINKDSFNILGVNFY